LKRIDFCCDIANWIDDKVQPEIQGSEYIQDRDNLYRYAATILRDLPMPRLFQIESVLSCTSEKYILFLYQAWRAIKNSDQSDFNQNFLKSLSIFCSKYGKGFLPHNWVSLDLSILSNFALNQGLVLPDIDELSNLRVILRPMQD
jgi:hypothetical protein